ncbi:hypothetical protein HAX54_024727, partial [Datura stramonium]|nr:hypothetical protein [Datura stramonium]
CMYLGKRAKDGLMREPESPSEARSQGPTRRDNPAAQGPALCDSLTTQEAARHSNTATQGDRRRGGLLFSYLSFKEYSHACKPLACLDAYRSRIMIERPYLPVSGPK